MTLEPSVASNPIERSIENAKDWVQSQMHPDGWFPFAQVQEEFVKGSWCTAQAITALMLVEGKEVISEVEKTISWLNDQKKEKGWGIMISDEPAIESTAWVLSAFLQAREIGLRSERIEESLEAGISWLLDCQNLDGGWGSWKNDISRTTTSSMVCSLLLQEGSHKKALKEAEKYLKDSQNEDGGWGFRKGEISNILGSSLTLSVLSAVSTDDTAIQLGYEFIESEQNADGTFAGNLFVHETIGREDRLLRREYFHLPLALYSLSVSGRANSIAVFRGLSKMLATQQSSGTWTNPNEPHICYHTYVALHYAAKMVKVVDMERFAEFHRIMEEYKNQEREYRILFQKNQLHQEIIRKALISGQRFVLTSGKQSNYYYNLKDVVLNPKTVKLIANLIWEMSADIQADSIGGPETGAIPVAVAVAERSLESEAPLRAFFIRRKPKGHGTKAFIEGPLRRGDRVILVDDVTTTGGSIKESIMKVEKFGCEVVRIYTIVDREEGATKNLGEHASLLYPLFKHSEVKGLV